MNGSSATLRHRNSRALVVGNAPGAGIEIKAGVEFAVLRSTAEFGVAVAAPQRPTAPAGAVVVFKHLNAVACPAQLKRRHHPSETGPEDEHRGALGIALEPDRPGIRGLCGKTHARHRAVHHRAAGRRSDERKKVTPAHVRCFALGHHWTPWVLCPSRVILTATLDRYRRHGTQTTDTLDVRKLHAPHKRRPKKAGPRRILRATRNPKMKDYCLPSGGAI